METKKILPKILNGEAINQINNYVKCRCCEHVIEVKTIDDMLQRAYEIIDNDKKVTQLLVDLKLDKYSVGISQEYTRFKMLSNPYADFMPAYRCVQEGESGIYLGFNENFTILETIEVSPEMFRNNHIRGYKAQFNAMSDNEKIKFLENAFGNYNTNIEGLGAYVEVKHLESAINTEIVLKMPNDRLSQNFAYAFYPNSDEYPYFAFDISHDTKNGRLDSIQIKLCHTEPITEPISTWLHQTLVSMYPDYGNAYLWFDGAAGCLENIVGYDIEGSEIAKKLEDWQAYFEDSFFITNMDWESFDKIGRALFFELRDIIKNDYILTYTKSYEETCGTCAEHEALS